MRDHKSSAPFQQAAQTLLNVEFAFGVEIGSGFVEDEDFGVG